MTQFLSAKWRKAFPSNETRAVIQFMRDRWEFIQSRPGGRKALSIVNAEPKITRFFGADLHGCARSAGLLGEFSYEKPRGQANLDTGKIDKPIRTDIEYQFARARPIPPLIFEFKKLRATESKEDQRQYFGSKGMLRFITGNYHEHVPHLAFMAGLIDTQVAVDQLRAALMRIPLAVGKLHTLARSDGELVCSPSMEFPALVEFDTIHSRPGTGDVSDLVLCHMFFQLVLDASVVANDEAGPGNQPIA